MPIVAIATNERYRDLYEDDQPFADALRELGCQVTPTVWDDPAVNWEAFDRVIIRSTWDYHKKPDAYREWLGGFRSRPGQLWNPSDAVLGNIHKGYLLDLERAGVEIVPTVLVRAGEDVSLCDVLGSRKWLKAVVKPAISASADGTWLASDDPADVSNAKVPIADAEDRFAEESQAHDLLIQPFMSEIITAGEMSLVFFNSVFSHAFRKKPAKGDYRVQGHLGGTRMPMTPSMSLVEQAASVLKATGHPLLYARVDGLEHDGRLVLIELEINEPFLELEQSPSAPRHFAEAVINTFNFN